MDRCAGGGLPDDAGAPLRGLRENPGNTWPDEPLLLQGGRRAAGTPVPSGTRGYSPPARAVARCSPLAPGGWWSSSGTRRSPWSSGPGDRPATGCSNTGSGCWRVSTPAPLISTGSRQPTRRRNPVNAPSPRPSSSKPAEKFRKAPGWRSPAKCNTRSARSCCVWSGRSVVSRGR